MTIIHELNNKTNNMRPDEALALARRDFGGGLPFIGGGNAD